MTPYLVLELKELRTLLPPDTFPVCSANPSPRRDPGIGRGAGELGWGQGNRGPILPRACPLWEDAHAGLRTCKSPASAPAFSELPAWPCSVRAALAPVQAVRSAAGERRRSRDPRSRRRGRAGGAGSSQSAPSLLHRTSFPAPTHPAQPLGETRRKRVASPGGSTEVERSWWLPRARGLCEQPGRAPPPPPPPRSLRGCLPPPQPQRGRRGAGRGSGAPEELETVRRNPKQMRREEIKQSGD